MNPRNKGRCGVQRIHNESAEIVGEIGNDVIRDGHVSLFAAASRRQSRKVVRRASITRRRHLADVEPRRDATQPGPPSPEQDEGERAVEKAEEEGVQTNTLRRTSPGYKLPCKQKRSRHRRRDIGSCHASCLRIKSTSRAEVADLANLRHESPNRDTRNRRP